MPQDGLEKAAAALAVARVAAATAEEATTVRAQLVAADNPAGMPAGAAATATRVVATGWVEVARAAQGTGK